MGKDKGQVQQNPKAEEQKKKLAEGTTKPLPTAGLAKTEEDKKVDAANLEKAKKIAADVEALRKRKEELEKEYKAIKDAEKAAKNKEKTEKEEAKKQSLAERAKKEKEIEEADAAIAKAQKDLEATEEWKTLEKAKKVREGIGPLPKVAKVRNGATRKSPTGVTNKMLRLLEHLKGGQIRGSRELAELTGIQKGKPFPEMEELGLIDVLVPDEGERGKRFKITKKGLEELAKAPVEK